MSRSHCLIYAQQKTDKCYEVVFDIRLQNKIKYFRSMLICLPILYNMDQMRENLILLYANNKGADQPAHALSLISVFAVCSLQSLISKLASGKISVFQLVSVAEQAGLRLTRLQTPKTGFLASRPICKQHRYRMSDSPRVTVVKNDDRS